MFRVNDLIVYPGYGVALIAREIKKDIQNQEMIFYELCFKHKDIKILVPKSTFESDQSGIRMICKKNYLEDCLSNALSLKDEYHTPKFQEFLMISWNRRSKDYQNRIRKGDFLDLLLIFRELKMISMYKDLSFGEKNILSQVDFLVSEEYSIIYNKEIELSKKEINSLIVSIFKDSQKEIKSKNSIDGIIFKEKEREAGIF